MSLVGVTSLTLYSLCDTMRDTVEFSRNDFIDTVFSL